MKIVDRHGLMQLPPGTLYQEWGSVPYELIIKHETCTLTAPGHEPENVTWYRTDLGAYLNEDGTQLKIDAYSTKDDNDNDDDTQYLVYEPADVEILIAKLQGRPHGESVLPVDENGNPLLPLEDADV